MRRRFASLLDGYGPCPVPVGSAEIHRGKVSVATAWQHFDIHVWLAAIFRAYRP
jgi:hypothetical protein